MSPDEIRIEFIKLRKKTTMASIARSLGVSQPAVQRVIDRHLVSNRIMRAISETIGSPPEVVFPEYFSKNEQKRELNNGFKN
jgi:lambda repressor-like predicted transcriptional regulator